MQETLVNHARILLPLLSFRPEYVTRLATPLSFKARVDLTPGGICAGSWCVYTSGHPETSCALRRLPDSILSNEFLRRFHFDFLVLLFDRNRNFEPRYGRDTSGRLALFHNHICGLGGRFVYGLCGFIN